MPAHKTPSSSSLSRERRKREKTEEKTLLGRKKSPHPRGRFSIHMSVSHSLFDQRARLKGIRLFLDRSIHLFRLETPKKMRNRLWMGGDALGYDGCSICLSIVGDDSNYKNSRIIRNSRIFWAAKMFLQFSSPIKTLNASETNGFRAMFFPPD